MSDQERQVLREGGIEAQTPHTVDSIFETVTARALRTRRSKMLWEGVVSRRQDYPHLDEVISTVPADFDAEAVVSWFVTPVDALDGMSPSAWLSQGNDHLVVLELAEALEQAGE